MRALIVFFALLTAWRAWRLREILKKRRRAALLRELARAVRERGQHRVEISDGFPERRA
jgi:hypothetical protein